MNWNVPFSEIEQNSGVEDKSYTLIYLWYLQVIYRRVK